LIALCPTCHALYHRGKISPQSIYAWKAMLVAIERAFDVQTIDKLLFLNSLEPDFLVCRAMDSCIRPSDGCRIRGRGAESKQ
jgi:hypothetical protein